MVLVFVHGEPARAAAGIHDHPGACRQRTSNDELTAIEGTHLAVHGHGQQYPENAYQLMLAWRN